MIPVRPQPEPNDFDKKVRQPGLNWLCSKGYNLNQPPPNPSKLKAFWRETQKELWEAYNGICAYLCIFIELPLGASSTDHFIAKSQNAGLAYEWSNYRLSCLGANRNKNRFDDILDPFFIQPETFLLNFSDGTIYPNPVLTPIVTNDAIKTIVRLKLNDPEAKRMRTRWYDEYLNGVFIESHLKRYSPFVWYEANRQGLL